METTLDQALDDVGSLHDKLFNFAFDLLRSDFKKKMPWLSDEEVNSMADDALLLSGV